MPARSNNRHDPDTLATTYGVDAGLPVTCACGRQTLAGKLHDVRGFPSGLYADAWVCDACMILPMYEGRITHAALAHYTGASPAAVARARAKHASEVAAGNHRPRPGCLDAPRDGAGGGAIGVIRGG